MRSHQLSLGALRYILFINLKCGTGWSFPGLMNGIDLFSLVRWLDNSKMLF